MKSNASPILLFFNKCKYLKLLLSEIYTRWRDLVYAVTSWQTGNGKKWNESGFRPPLCTYRLNWARRTSWGWWDDWDDTVLQTHDSKFEPWRSEAEHAASRSRRLTTILNFTRGWGRNIFCFFQTAETGNRTPSSGVKGSDANHYPRAPAQQETVTQCSGNVWPAGSQTVSQHYTNIGLTVKQSVAISLWFCRKRRKAIFTHSLSEADRFRETIRILKNNNVLVYFTHP